MIQLTPMMVAHGGVGSPPEDSDGPQRACERGMVFLTGDGGHDRALQAVLEAGVVLEDDERFNAGTGASLRINGSVQQDAIVACCDGRLGAVACLDSTRNPLRVARLVMDSPHVLLVGEGATAFARERGFNWHECRVEKRVAAWRKTLERVQAGELKPHEAAWKGMNFSGTIGAVARCADGRFAVSCSTGGTSLMLPGRVGDSPIFGAGTMVGPLGAICATGDGEEIIRRLLCSRVYQRVADGEALQAVCDDEVAKFPKPFVLGLIALTRDEWAIAATDDHMAAFSLSAGA